jgi:hypothetical protein
MSSTTADEQGRRRGEVAAASWCDTGTFVVLAVVVVYGRRLEEVESWRWVKQCLMRTDQIGLGLRHVLIYDNSPTPLAEPESPAMGLTYCHDPSNGGTAAAFARGAGLAREKGCAWMLWIDQDTLLPSGYLMAARNAMSAAEVPPAALVPRVVSAGVQVSPAVISDLGFITLLTRGSSPVAGARVTAVASGCLVNTSAFASLGPVPDRLWLDGVDHWVFCMLHRKGLHVAMVDCELQHHLSVSNLGAMPAWRVVSVLDSELCLLAVLPMAARLAYPYRLLRYLMRIADSNPVAARAAGRWIFSRMMGHGDLPKGGSHAQ